MTKKLKGNPRDAALAILLEVEKNQAYSNLLVSKKIKEYDLSGPDRALMTELAYGTLQNRDALDYYLKPFVKGKTEMWVRILLRLSVYQFMYLDRIPEHAVVNEAVTIAKFRGHKGISGMVNGVLRSFLRQGPPSLDDIPDALDRLSIETSHPKWLLESWIAAYGLETTEKIAKMNNTAPPQTVRVATHRISIDEAIAQLTSEGFDVRRGLIPESLHLSGKPASTSELFKTGYITIQDESSMLPAHALMLEPGLEVLDLCAAPGGKTTHIAQLMKDTGSVTALDLHEHKIKLIHDNADRLQLSSIQAQAGDAREASTVLQNKQFDRILIDAPCSGYGVIRRKPDMKYNKKPDDATRLTVIQLAILEQAYALLKRGGILVYSTCTIDRTENQDVVQKFLDAHQDLTLIEMPEVMEPLPHTGQGPGFQVMPYEDGDGFYLAAIQKK